MTKRGLTYRPGFAALLAALAIVLAGCGDMYNESRIKPLEESRFYADRQSSRPLVPGTIPRGMANAGDEFHTGMSGGKPLTAIPAPIDSVFLARGQDRFNTFCSPCHGRTGEGNGMIVQRGFPRPNSFHQDSVRAKPVGYYYDVITNGFGRMYSYAPSIPPGDRWAIVAYLRALQLSRNIDAKRLTAGERNRLGR